VIQAETLEEAQAIVNSSPHARDGMLADSGAGRGVASAYWISCKNPFPQLMGRALGPIPQELFFLVGWAPEPVLIIFARGLLDVSVFKTGIMLTPS